MACKGVCHKYRAVWISQTLRYASGHKRCLGCDLYLKWDGLHCPCCGKKLRCKPRTGKSKQMFVEQKMGLRKII
jgi:hypothetical protein